MEEFEEIRVIVSTSDLSRSKTMKSNVRTNEVEKEDESRDSRISRVKGVEAALNFVPSLEVTVKSLDEVVRNVVIEALDANM